jgi:hypothetical protein
VCFEAAVTRSNLAVIIVVQVRQDAELLTQLRRQAAAHNNNFFIIFFL